MTDKQKKVARLTVLLLILVAAVVWKGQGYFSEWQGTVTQVVMPEGKRLGYAVVRDGRGRVFRIDLPIEQVSQLQPGDKLAKPRMSLRVKVVEKAPEPAPVPTVAPKR